MINSEDGVRIKSINCEDVIIVEDENPKIVTFVSEFKNKSINLWLWNFGEYKIKIYVPKNTIKYQYNIDLQ